MKLALRNLPATLRHRTVRAGAKAAISYGDEACPVCDHPFPRLSHMCVGTMSARRPTAGVSTVLRFPPVADS